MKIEHEDLLKSYLSRGINLFVGAGFSVLPDNEGNKLPTGSELRDEICDFFKEDAKALSLEDICTIVNSKNESGLQDFLRHRFTLTTYNKLYDNICNINIKSFITTNIDNLIHLIIRKSKRYYLLDATRYGTEKCSSYKIEYYPLHGNVANQDSKLHFGRFDIAIAEDHNRDLFDSMFVNMSKRPTLFWGYSMNDSGVKHCISRILKESNKQDVWVQIMPGSPQKALYESVGAFIIESDTKDLLSWLGDSLSSSEIKEKGVLSDDFFSIYKIPSVDMLNEGVPIIEFYKYANTNWYSILYGHDYKRPLVAEVQNATCSCKNVLLVGSPFSGKTALAMRLAMCSGDKNKLFLPSLNLGLAQKIVQKISGASVTVFIDDCCNDAESYKLLASAENIKTIAFSSDYAYETTKHIFDSIEIKTITIPDISQREAEGLFKHLPDNLKIKSELQYRKNPAERYSMLEFLSYNVREVLSEKNVKHFLEIVRKNTLSGFELVAITSYLTYNKSLLSTDIILSYLNVNYYEAKEYIRKVSSSLAELSEDLFRQDIADQDYYSLRSGLFSFYCNKLLSEYFRENYAEVIRKFIKNVNFYNIYKLNLFRRSAFDSQFFYNIFGKNAEDLYELLLQKDPESQPYTLQQSALYKSKIGKFTDAFNDIDKAKNLRPNNFSIKNAYAVILFESNCHSSNIDRIIEAIKILEQCYNNDKRKRYHASIYSKIAIFLYEKFGKSDYLEQAYNWLSSISKEQRLYGTDYDNLIKLKNAIQPIRLS